MASKHGKLYEKSPKLERDEDGEVQVKKSSEEMDGETSSDEMTRMNDRHMTEVKDMHKRHENEHKDMNKRHQKEKSKFGGSKDTSEDKKED